MKKGSISILLLLFFTANFSVSSQSSKTAISSFVNTAVFKHASISLSIKKMTGEDYVSYDADKSLTPASTLKLLTTATALETLGSSYKFRTTLGRAKNRPNKLIVYGYGDPTLGSDKFGEGSYSFLEKWAEEIFKEFGKENRLNLKVADNYFGYEGVSRKWQREDMGNYYAPGTYGISLFDNTYKLSLNSAKGNATPKVTKTDPFMDKMNFYNTLGHNTTGRDNGYIVGDPMSNDRMLIGDIPTGRAAFAIKGAIPNPGLLLSNVLSDRLEQGGLKTNNIGTSMRDYYQHVDDKDLSIIDADVFYTHYSPSMEEIVREVNVESDNHYAENLIRAVGRNKNPDVYANPLDEGITATLNLWKSKGIDTESIFLYDGSGLAPANSISASALTDVLIYMYNKSQNKTAFFNSLPKAGQEGTVRNFLKGTKLAGKVHAKSGSIAGVLSYSGYYINGAESFAFTIIVNKFNGNSRETRDAIQKLLLSVF